MSSIFRIVTAEMLLTAALLAPLGAASAGTVTRTDPQGDASAAKFDIRSARVTFDDRITVQTHFVTVRPGTSYLAFIDPGRRGTGAQFGVMVRVRRDSTTVGRLLGAEHPPAFPNFTTVPCPGLRTSVSFASDTLRVSAPSRCLRRFAPLGRAIWVSLNSLPPSGPAAGDILPNDPPFAFRVPRG